MLLCNLTYKDDWDLPGGVVELNESPRVAVSREIEEELALEVVAGPLVLTDWLPPWSGWDDAVCLVFDGGVHERRWSTIVPQAREIRQARFCTLAEVHQLCADFTARRIDSALASSTAPGPLHRVRPPALTPGPLRGRLRRPERLRTSNVNTDPPPAADGSRPPALRLGERPHQEETQPGPGTRLLGRT